MKNPLLRYLARKNPKLSSINGVLSMKHSKSKYFFLLLIMLIFVAVPSITFLVREYNLSKAETDALKLFSDNKNIFVIASQFEREISNREGDFYITRDEDLNMDYCFFLDSDISYNPDLHLSTKEQEIFEQLFSISYEDMKIMNYSYVGHSFQVYNYMNWYVFIVNPFDQNECDQWQSSSDYFQKIDDGWYIATSELTPY